MMIAPAKAAGPPWALRRGRNRPGPGFRRDDGPRL